MTDDAAIVPFGMSQEEAKIAELSKLSPLEYEKCRENAATELGFRVSVLDKLVESQRPKPEENAGGDSFEMVEPWPDPVDGAALGLQQRATV